VNDPTALSLATSALAILAGYLAGSIPFGYLIAYWVKGIDIRTVGSGNVGATNVGRTLGFRYFLIVLTLDLLKGFLPTIGFPWMLTRLTGSHVWSLPVLIAMAAILEIPRRQRSRDQPGMCAGARCRFVRCCRGDVPHSAGHYSVCLVVVACRGVCVRGGALPPSVIALQS
jgi:hypothetical protein